MKRFVGFGFGPIQSGLFILEALRSGNFDHFTVAEVDATLVAAVRRAGGWCVINVAGPDGIQQVRVGPVEMLNPQVVSDRTQLIHAVAAADELATALPSVGLFEAGGAASVASILAAGFQQRTQTGVLYTAENHNEAAEILQAALARHGAHPSAVEVLNTVIGKMSGVITEPGEMARLGLVELVPGWGKAVLVEQFNRILVTQVRGGYTRGIEVFAEKPDLLPFEEAKLYGHNAIHALAGYLARQRGYTTMAEALQDLEILQLSRYAFLEESGAALIKKYQHTGETLFTSAGYRAYAEDLLHRMANPYLNDLVVRVTRDPVRKLGWSDRIFGTMRLALALEIAPRTLARGAGAALRLLLEERALAVTRPTVTQTLGEIWGAKSPDPLAETLTALTWDGMHSANA